MALAIRSIPTLHGKDAERFVRMADESAQKPKVDFSKQIALGRAILEKAKING